MAVLVTPEGMFDVLVALSTEQCAMLRSLVYKAAADAEDAQQADFLNTLIDQLEQAEGEIADDERLHTDSGPYDPKDDLAGALVLLLQFDSRAYRKQSDLARDLVSAKKLAKLALARAGYHP